MHADDAAIRESEARFRQIAENLNVGIWIYTADFAETLYVSPRSAEIWGRSLDEAYANPLRFLELVHPDDAPVMLRAMQQKEAGEVTVRTVRADGDVRWLRIRGFPIRDEHGRTYRIAGITEDITDRRTLEQGLQQSEAHYRRLVETAPYAVYVVDREGRFTEVNETAEQVLDRSAGDVIGRPFQDVIHPEDLPDAVDTFGRILEGTDEKIEIELRVIQPDGEARWLSIAVAPVREGGAVTGAHGIARDVTLERAREQHFRRSERFASMGTLISGVAHELNNPLQAIAGFADLLLAGESDPRLQEESLETISREARRAARIVSDLKLLSRQTHDDRNRREEVDINSLVEHVLRTRRYSLETSNIEVRPDTAVDLPPVIGDRDRIEQVLLNLIVNAEQALSTSDADRLLVVRTRATSMGIGISIYDNGPGIAAEALPHLFDPFWTTKAPGVGTGLGLALVHSIVQDHGGRVHVESEIGRGALFHLDLPARHADAPAATSESVVPKRTAPVRMLRVLAVDDEPAIRLLMMRVARRRGHVADAADDGGAALRLIEAAEAEGAPYDLILSDLRMPGVSGGRLVNALLDRDEVYRHRLVLVTGDPTNPEAASLADDRDVRVLAKPMTLSQLDELFEQAEAAS